MIVILILAAVWSMVALQWIMRRWNEGRPDNSVMSFRAQLSTLERATPGTSLHNLPPGSASIAGMGMITTPQLIDPRRRRRDVLIGLLAATGFSFLLVLAVGGSFTVLLLLASAGATAAYVYALRQMHLRSMERTAKVRPLRRPRAPAPTFALRRTASN